MHDHGATTQIESSAAAQPTAPEQRALADGALRVPTRRPWRALGLSLLLLAGLTAIKFVWAQQVGNAPPYLMYFAVIVVAAWYGGWRIGLLVTGLSALIGNSLFGATSGTALHTAPGLLRLVSFLVEGGTMSALAAYAQQSRVRASHGAQSAELSLAKLRSVLGAVADGITVQDAEGRLIYANGPAAELAGFASESDLLRASPQQLTQRFELFGPDGQPFRTSELPGRSVLQGEPSSERLIRLRDRNSGAERWVQVRANAVSLAGAAAPFAVNVFRDVTAAREQQEELRLGREWFATALRSIGEAVIATDASGRITFMNPQAELLTRWDHEAAYGRSLAEVFRIVREVDHKPTENLVSRVLREGRVVGLATHSVLLARDGSELAIDDSAAPIRKQSGELVGTVLVFRDVSTKRQAERRRAFIASATAELASSLDYTRALVTLARLAVPDMADFCAVDILEANGWRRLTIHHVDPARLEALLELERRQPDDPDRSSLRVDVLQAGDAVFLPEMRDSVLAAAPEARAHLESLRAIGLRSFIGVPLHVHGELIGVISLALSSGKRAYRTEDLQLAIELGDRAGLAVSNARLFARAEAARGDAEQANRAKDEFLAMLGHELRNPLAPIVTALQLMKLRAADVFEKERSIVERQVRHMITLVDDLLDVSRITRGKVELNQEPVELAATVHKALELAGPLIEQRQHTVDVAVNSTLRVLGDTVRLAQVVSNLLTNAAKYTPPRGHIWISATTAAGEVTLTVRDDGVGVEPELLPRIFDLFVQGGQALDRSQGGLGLGLTIVRSVVELHGGRVVARSQGRGKGSEFSVTLPLLAGAAAAQLVSETRPQPSAAIAKGARILIVDDNLDALALLSEALQLVGYETHEAEDAAGALAKAEEIMPQLALLDIGLPVMNGYELARRLRAIPGLEHIKLAALTGYGQPSDKERTREAGFDEHLVKPIAIEKVQQVVARLLQPQ
jgi:PAS domain S-box-containing protein